MKKTKEKKRTGDLLGALWVIIFGCLPVLLAVVTLFYLRIGRLPDYLIEEGKSNSRHYVCISDEIAGVETLENGMLVITYPDGDHWWKSTQHHAKEYRIACTENTHISTANLPDRFTFGEEWPSHLQGKPVNSVAPISKDEYGYGYTAEDYGYVPSGYVAVISPDAENTIELLPSYKIWGYAEANTFFPFLVDTLKSLCYCVIHGVPHMFFA